MSEEEAARIRALNRCTFPVGSSHKRFVRDMAVKNPDFPLTPKQAAFVEGLTWRYRRQLPAALVPPTAPAS